MNSASAITHDPLAAAAPSAAADRLRRGYLLGLIGVALFALTIPMTRLASGSVAAPQLDPVFVALGRAAVAGLLSVAWLAATRASWRSASTRAG